MLKLIIILVFIFSNFLKADDKVTLKLEWLHQFQFAGYYMAKEKGFYKNYNLDVDIKEYKFGANQVADVLNEKNTYAIGKSSLIIDALSGKELVILAAIFQNSPMVLLTTNPNIKTPNDLYNKNIMLTPDARSAVAINSMISSQGIKLKDMNFQDHSFKLDDLINGKTDAMGSYLSNEPYILKSRGIKYNILDPKEFGFDFYGGLLFTSKRELKNNPTRVQNFNLASLRGWDYAFHNINETVNLIYEKYNTQNKSLKALTYEAEILKKLSQIGDNNLGKIELNKIEEIIKIYSLLGYSLNINNISNIIIDQKKVLLSDKEKEFLDTNTLKFLINDSTFKPLYKEYIKILAKKLNFKYELIYTTNTTQESEYLKSNTAYLKLDINLNNDIHSKSKISKAIADYDLVIATTSDYENFIYDLSLLNSKKVAVNINSINIESLKKNHPKIKFIVVKNSFEGLTLLGETKITAFIDSILNIKSSIQKNEFNNIKISGKTDLRASYSFITNIKNENLIKILNKGIDKLDKKELDAIKKKNISINYITRVDNSLFYKLAIPLLIILFFVLIINIRLQREINKNKKAQIALKELAEIDTLTNIFNRRKITEIIKQQIELSSRYKRPLSTIFLDIDNFKHVNDNFGHQTGDIILKEFSAILKNNLRNVDAVGRWGGEEFIIILPETKKVDLENVLEKLQEAIKEYNFYKVKDVTCSFGATTLLQKETYDNFISRADKAMYHIKKTGKNGYSIA